MMTCLSADFRTATNRGKTKYFDSVWTVWHKSDLISQNRKTQTALYVVPNCTEPHHI